MKRISKRRGGAPKSPIGAARKFNRIKGRVASAADAAGRLQVELEEIAKRRGVDSPEADRAHLRAIGAMSKYLIAQSNFTFELEKALGRSYAKERTPFQGR